MFIKEGQILKTANNFMLLCSVTDGTF